MRYHVYYIDTFGEPFVKVQMEDEQKAVDMVKRYSAKGNRTPKLVEKTRFTVSLDDMVIILIQSWV